MGFMGVSSIDNPHAIVAAKSAGRRWKNRTGTNGKGKAGSKPGSGKAICIGVMIVILLALGGFICLYQFTDLFAKFKSPGGASVDPRATTQKQTAAVVPAQQG